MNVDEAIEIVREFNKENRYRDCGKLNNAIDIVCEVAERHKDEKILLTEEEKDYLKKILNLDMFYEICEIRKDEYLLNYIINFIDIEQRPVLELTIYDKNKFKYLENGTTYGLSVLGLQE